jgi:hypothetical protein
MPGDTGILDCRRRLTMSRKAIDPESGAAAGARTPQDAALPQPGPQRDGTVRIFRCFIVAHLLVWTVVPLLTRNNPPLDLVEQVFWGQEWQLGYTKHPPLPSWICGAVTLVTGRALWAYYLLPHLATALAFWAVWRLAREIVSPRLALMSVCLLECCPFYTFECKTLNNNVGLHPCWALAVLFLYRALQTRKKASWIALGAWLGLGMLTKYTTAILAGSILAFGLIHPQARKAWREPGPYLTLLAAILVFLPHALWVAAHGFKTIQYAFEQVRPENSSFAQPFGFLHFAAYQLGMIAPLLLAATPLTGLRWRLRALQPAERFPRAMLASVVLAPVAIHLAIAAWPNVELDGMYGCSLWLFTGLLLLACLEVRTAPAAWRRAGLVWGAVAIITIAGALMRPYLAAHGANDRTNFPGRLLARRANEAWNQRYDRPLPIVGGDYFLAGNVALFSPHFPRVYQGWHDDGSEVNVRDCPWISESEFRRQGGMILWNIHDYPQGMPADVARRLGVVETIELPPLPFSAGAECPPRRVAAALVPPRGE